MRLIRFATIVAASIVTAMPAQAQSLITNGDFESGTFAGWTVVNTGQSGNDFYVIANGGNVPVSAHPTQVNAGGGNFVAVSDQYGPGGEALLQSFTTTGGFLTLSFDWFNNTHTPYIGTEIDGSQQAGRVDILSALASPLSSTGVVYNFLLNAGQYTPFGTTVP